jgi:hypothetical protein
MTTEDFKFKELNPTVEDMAEKPFLKPINDLTRSVDEIENVRNQLAHQLGEETIKFNEHAKEPYVEDLWILRYALKVIKTQEALIKIHTDAYKRSCQCIDNILIEIKDYERPIKSAEDFHYDTAKKIKVKADKESRQKDPEKFVKVIT